MCFSKSMPRLNQRGVIAQGVILLLLLAGIGVGIYLVQHPQIFKPKASSEKVEWITSENDPDNCVTIKDGKTVTTCTKVKFRINVPQQVQ